MMLVTAFGSKNLDNEDHLPSLEEMELPPINGAGQPKGSKGISNIINLLLSIKTLNLLNLVAKF